MNFVYIGIIIAVLFLLFNKKKEDFSTDAFRMYGRIYSKYKREMKEIIPLLSYQLPDNSILQFEIGNFLTVQHPEYKYYITYLSQRCNNLSSTQKYALARVLINYVRIYDNKLDLDTFFQFVLTPLILLMKLTDNSDNSNNKVNVGKEVSELAKIWWG